MTATTKSGGCSARGLRVTSPGAREFLAECGGEAEARAQAVSTNFSGTFLLVVFGCGSIAQSVLSLGLKGDFFSINWG